MRCQPGDIAIVLNGGDVPEMVGRIVEVVGATDPYPGSLLPAWTCRSAGSPLNGYIVGTCTPRHGPEVDIPDAWLHPIRGSEPAAETMASDDSYAWG